MVFTETELAYLADQRLGRLATAQPNGTLQVSKAAPSPRRTVVREDAQR